MMDYLTELYRRQLRWAIQHRWIVAGVALAALAGTFFWALSASLERSSCRIWMKARSGHGAPWPTAQVFRKARKFIDHCRYVFASFPEVSKVVSQVGRPDDGTDTGGFGNTEYFVDLKPKDQWRPVFHKDKDELIAAMNRAAAKIPRGDLELLPAD